jgi:hypothetical protein
MQQNKNLRIWNAQKHVLDLWHFGTDPDPRVRTTDLRIRILLFSSVSFKMLIKVFFFLLFEGTFTSFFKDKKSQRNHKTVEIKIFLFLLDDGTIQIRTKD